MKKNLTTILVTLIIAMYTACGSSEKRPTTYPTINLDTIGQEVDDNLARATEKYVGNCYAFYAEFSYLSQDLKRMSAYEIDPAYELGVQISGNVLDKEDQQTLLNANDGDVILIKGKITDIKLGFMISAELKMDVYEIKIYKNL